MTNFEPDNGTTRDDLVQRVALMETMIAEGRRSTARYGWMFVMWGVVYFTAALWTIFLPFKNWAWPVCIAASIVVIGVVKSRQKRIKGRSESVRARSIEATWKVMGIAVSLYVAAAIVSHHGGSPAYFSAILFFIGLAHGISATILRWGAQRAVTAVWWVGGIATFFFTTPVELISIFLGASFFGMILFGLYAMMLERRRTTATSLQNQVQHHA
jgi:hypothetical protein